MNLQANSVDEWILLADRHSKAARMMMLDPATYEVAWSHAGFVCECLLKAAIMAREGLNQWPDRKSRPDLHTHDLSKLASVLGMSITAADSVAPAWAVVLQWRMEHRYRSHQMPFAVAQGLNEAIFSEKGVGLWIARFYLKAKLKQVESIMTA
ncbi:hypothetical protein ACSV5N_01505 [Agrobacterium salinitolerans]|uniref:hypothetical protein n=1 Tax=Agrobacterium salinitolerans TaxID=1183413 RepID=UPI003FD3A582